MKNVRFFERFFLRFVGAGVALTIAALVGYSPPALAKARVVAILPLDVGGSTKAAAEHYTDSIVSRLAAYPGYDAARLNAGQEPQESAAKIGADVYVVGEFDKKGDVLEVSLESFSVTTNQFLGNLVVTATDLDVPGKIDFTPLFGKAAGAAPTPAPAQLIDPIGMQSAATPPASLEASPEPSATPVAKRTTSPVPAQAKPTAKSTSHATAKPTARPTPRPSSTSRPQQTSKSKNASSTNKPKLAVRTPQARPQAPRANVKPKAAAAVAPTPTPTPEPTPVPTSIPTPVPTSAARAQIASINNRAFTLIPLQSPDGESTAKRDPLLDQSTLDLTRRFAASQYSISIGPTKDRDEASRDAAAICRDSNSAGVLVGTMKYDLKKAGLNRLINKNATDAITRVDIRFTLLDCTGKFVWKGQSVKNLADLPKTASGDPDVVEAAITELVARFETRP